MARDPSRAPVPATFAELTAAWLQYCLRSGHNDEPGAGLDVAVSQISVEPLGTDVGLLGDLARVRIRYRQGVGPASVIVKLPPADPGGYRVGAMLRAWAREVAFYRNVAPTSPGVRVPLCYYTGADDEAERWVVVLEDCPAEPVDVARGASRQQADVAVDGLAAFHGAWWGSNQRFDWMPGFDVGGVGGLQEPWLDAIPTFLDRFGAVVPSPTDEWLQRFAPTLRSWSSRAAGEPLTIVHADYRVDNLIFSDGAVTMIDWQTALRGPGAMDLTSFIATGLSIEDRRGSEDELIERYLDGLQTAGHSVDPAWFARSYDENLLWWMGQFAHNLARLEAEDPQVRQTLDTMIERTYTAALDRDVGRLL